ncbi:MAG: hypothetical protein V4586_12420 [Pseudomonadota bacterium]
MIENLRKYMRLVDKRSCEHNVAFKLLYEQRLYGACAGLIRQEIDNLMRVDYLAFHIPLSDRDGLCRDALSGIRWEKTTRGGKPVSIQDVDFHTLAASNHSWVSLAYGYSSKFIHLTNFWDYDCSDPVVTMPAADRQQVISYLNTYHGFQGNTLTMDQLIEYLPMVFEKIRSNVEFYVSEEEGFLLENL